MLSGSVRMLASKLAACSLRLYHITDQYSCLIAFMPEMPSYVFSRKYLAQIISAVLAASAWVVSVGFGPPIPL